MPMCLRVPEALEGHKINITLIISHLRFSSSSSSSSSSSFRRFIFIQTSFPSPLPFPPPLFLGVQSYPALRPHPWTSDTSFIARPVRTTTLSFIQSLFIHFFHFFHFFHFRRRSFLDPPFSFVPPFLVSLTSHPSKTTTSHHSFHTSPWALTGQRLETSEPRYRSTPTLPIAPWTHSLEANQCNQPLPPPRHHYNLRVEI